MFVASMNFNEFFVNKARRLNENRDQPKPFFERIIAQRNEFTHKADQSVWITGMTLEKTVSKCL